jgi:SAM-dependent methyltransferase
MKKFLHVGCGMSNHSNISNLFPIEEWQEVRLDIDAQVNPDIIADITNMACVPGNSFDALFSSHNLEHLYSHQVKYALAEFHRILKPGGKAIVRVPNILDVAAEIAKGNLDEALYTSPAGPICAIDILYGFRPSVEEGNHFMAHRTAFIPSSLGEAMERAGFSKVLVRNDGYRYSMEGIGEKL